MEDGGWISRRAALAIFHLRSSILVFEAMNHFLAGPVLHELGPGVAEIEREAEEFDGFFETGRRFRLHQRAEFGGGFVHGVCAEAHRHAFVRTHRVDRDGKRRHDSIHRRLLDEQRFATAGLLHFAIGEFGDLQLGGQRLGDSLEFASPVQRVDPLTEGIECHKMRSFASWLECREGRQIRRQFVWRKCLDGELDEAERGNTEIHRHARSVHDDPDA